MAGFRTFATGEVLTAANVNDFLMKQSVMVFADASARTAALGAEVVEGMLTYNEDTEQLEVFDGSAFVLAAPAPPAGIGSNVVQTVKTDTFSTSSVTFVDVPDLSVTITPSTDTARILVLGMVAVSQTVQLDHTGPHLRVVRDSTPIFVGDAETRSPVTFGINGQLNPRTVLSVVVCAVDLPSTSDPVTYKIEIRIPQSTGVAVVNRTGVDSASDLRFPRTFSSLTVIEVAA